MNPLTRVSELIPTLPGWTEVEKAQRLTAMVLALKPELSVEIGVYGGRSLLALAFGHKANAYGAVLGIDPFTNEAACEGYAGENLKSWQAVPFDTIYKGLTETLRREGVQNVVLLVREKSDNVTPPAKIDLLHLDGQHTDQASRDVGRFAPNVRVGGLCVVDDTGWTNDGDAPVQRAVELLLVFGFVKLYDLGTGAVFQRVNADLRHSAGSAASQPKETNR